MRTPRLRLRRYMLRRFEEMFQRHEPVAHCSPPACSRAASHAVMTLSFQTTTRPENRMGWGKAPALIHRQSVARLIGRIPLRLAVVVRPVTFTYRSAWHSAWASGLVVGVCAVMCVLVSLGETEHVGQKTAQNAQFSIHEAVKCPSSLPVPAPRFPRNLPHGFRNLAKPSVTCRAHLVASHAVSAPRFPRNLPMVSETLRNLPRNLARFVLFGSTAAHTVSAGSGPPSQHLQKTSVRHGGGCVWGGVHRFHGWKAEIRQG